MRDPDLGSNWNYVPLREREALFYGKSSHPGSELLDLFYLNEVSKLCSYDGMRQVSVHWQKNKTRFPAVFDSDGVNKRGMVQSQEFSSRFFPVYNVQYTTYRRSPCQQMAAKLLLFIKFGSSIGHGESITADKFLLGVHIKCIFLLRVHTFHFLQMLHDEFKHFTSIRSLVS